MNPKFGTYKPSPIQELVLDIIYALPRNTLGRSIACMLGKAFTAIWPQQLFDHEIEGLKARFCLTTNEIERRFFFMPQFYDYDERQFIATHLSPHSVFVDVGANVGLNSLWAALYAHGGVVLSFEPDSELFARLQDNIRVNKLSCSIITENYALTPAKPLLDTLHQHKINKIDILKISMSGLEDAALLPFFDAAEKALYPKFIIIEDNSKLCQGYLFSALKERGYRVLHPYQMNCILELAETVTVAFPAEVQQGLMRPALD